MHVNNVPISMSGTDVWTSLFSAKCLRRRILRKPLVLFVDGYIWEFSWRTSLSCALCGQWEHILRSGVCKLHPTSVYIRSMRVKVQWPLG